ncbi:MAG: NEW3 domain-containing protein [Patescibacteria group bacterium]
MNGSEICDGNSTSCTTNGYQGTKSCDMTGGNKCTAWNNCQATEWCGDSIINGNEQCDGTDEVCTTTGGYQGMRECDMVGGGRCELESCQTTEYCGDGVKNGPEACDGVDGVTGAQTCAKDCKIIEPVTVIASKIVCDNESDLPNWGAGHTDGSYPYPTTSPKINSATASAFLESHPNCHPEERWSFQWEYANKLGTWHTFSDTTGADGSATETISDLNGTNEIRLREVEQNGYIPFTYVNGHTNNSDNVSAEMYCYNDVYNYDNYDYITGVSLGHTYYCVGFNVLKAYCGDGKKNQESEECDGRDGVGEYQFCTDKCTLQDETFDIHGYKWNDSDGDRNKAPEESLLALWRIFIDKNNNDQFDADEPSDLTDDGVHYGWYSFKNLPAGTYKICEVLKEGWQQTYPYDPSCHTVTLPDKNLKALTVSVNETTGPEYNFGNMEIPTYDLNSFKWDDLDGDGIFDNCNNNITNSGVLTQCEQKLAGWTIFIDKNGNGILNGDEASTLTDVNGMYHFSDLLAGTYNVCEVQQPGWSQTFPASPACHTVTLPNSSIGDTCAMINDFIGDAVISTNVAARLLMCSFGNRKVPEISISKSVDMPTANEGDTLTYTITVKNTGTAGMYGLLVEDTLPTNTTLVADSFNPVPDNVTGDTYQWYTSIAPGETKAFSFKVTVNAGLPFGTTTITNTATGKCSELKENLVAIPYVSCNIANQTATAITTVTKVEKSITPVITFTLTKKVDKTITNPNDTLTYTIVVTNTGNAAATNVTLTDTLPAGLTYLDTNGVNTGETTKTWTWTTIAAGASETVTYKTHVDSKATAKQYVNSATVKADGVPGVTATATSEVRTPSVLGEETATLAITKTAKENTVNPGGTITFTVTVTNNGNTPALNTVLTDTLPQGMVFADNKTTTHSWDLGDLVPTESATRTYEVKVDSGTLPGKYVNTATAKADSTASVTAQANVEVIAGKVLGEETDIVPTVITLPSTGGAGLLPSLIAGLSILGSGLILAKRIK